MTLCSLTTQTPFDMLLSIWLYAIYTVHHSKGCDLIGLFKTRCFSPKRSDVFILNCNVSWHTVWLLTKLRGEFEFRVVKAFYMQSLILVNTIVKFSGDICVLLFWHLWGWRTCRKSFWKKTFEPYHAFVHFSNVVAVILQYPSRIQNTWSSHHPPMTPSICRRTRSEPSPGLLLNRRRGAPKHY